MAIYIWVILGFLALIYFNIGYWGGKNWYNGFEEQNDLNWFQKFQLGTESRLLPGSDYIGDKKLEALCIALSVLIWPIGLAVSLVIWTVKLVFLGRFGRLIGRLF